MNLYDPIAEVSNQEMSKVVFCLPNTQIALVEQRLSECGWSIYQLDGIGDAPTLFSVVKQKLPLDPPLSGNVNWNALSDSLWYGLVAQPPQKVAICWLDAHLLLQCDSAAFLIAVECFQDVALMLRDESQLKKVALPTLLVLLFGAGPSFTDTFVL